MSEATTFVDDDPPERFTITANDLIEAPELTPQASFWLIYLKSKPKGWKPNVKQLTGAKAVGRTAVENALQELVEAGYMRREVEREGGRIVGQSYRFSWEPRWKNDPSRFGLRRRQKARSAPEPENLVTENLNTAEPDLVDPRVVSTEPNQVLIEASTNDSPAAENGDEGEAVATEQMLPIVESIPVVPPIASASNGTGREPDPFFDAIKAAFPEAQGSAVGQAKRDLLAAGWEPGDVDAVLWVIHGRNRAGRTLANLRKQAGLLDRDEVRALAVHREVAATAANAAFDAHAAGRLGKVGVGMTRESTSVVIAEMLVAGHSLHEVKHAMTATTRWSAAALAVAAKPASGGGARQTPADKERLFDAAAARAEERDREREALAVGAGNVIALPSAS